MKAKKLMGISLVIVYLMCIYSNVAFGLNSYINKEKAYTSITSPLPKSVTDKYFQDIKNAKTPEQLKIIEENFNKKYKDRIENKETVFYDKNNTPQLVKSFLKSTSRVAPQLGDIKIEVQTINGWGEEKIADTQAQTLAQMRELNTLIGIALAFAKPAYSIAYAVLSYLDQNEVIYYRDLLLTTKNAYNMDKKIVSVYSQTPTGNDWVTYIIAYKRTAYLFSTVHYFKNNQPYITTPRRFGIVQVLTAQFYNDYTYLQQLARGMYNSGNRTIEIYNYDNGSVWNNNNIVN